MFGVYGAASEAVSGEFAVHSLQLIVSEKKRKRGDAEFAEMQVKENIRGECRVESR